jgi:hypothetical protein
LRIDAFADSDAARPVFHVDCVFELECELEENFTPTEVQLRAYQKGNAVFLCWPYMREFVQNAVARLGLVAPPIPLLRVGRMTGLQAGEGTPVAPKRSRGMRGGKQEEGTGSIGGQV